MTTIPNIEFVKGIPENLEKDSYFDIHKRNLMVIDDQMADAGNDKRIVNLFTRGSHHRNLSVIFIVQNLFHQGKGSRSISLNSHYLVLFKNSRDKLQILTLAKQMYNNNNNNNNRIFIQDNPSVQSTVINGVLFHKDKDQTITPGTPRPTLCDKCVGSLTSHRVMNIEVL